MMMCGSAEIASVLVLLSLNVIWTNAAGPSAGRMKKTSSTLQVVVSQRNAAEDQVEAIVMH